jgi:hypothetical protein
VTLVTFEVLAGITDMNLWEFFVEGGWGMYPTLVLGLVTLVAAARFAWAPERRRLGFIAGMWATTLAQILHSTLTDFAAVFSALVHIAEPDDRVRVMFEGFKECTRPGILGGVFLILALLFVSIGLNRATQRAEA